MYFQKMTRNLKKVAALLAMIVLVASMWTLPITVHAAGAVATVSTDTTTVSAGDQFDVVVSINSEDDTLLGPLSFTLTYDPAVVSITDSEGTSFNGNLRWSSGSVESRTYSERFHFTAVADGTTEIRFADAPAVQDTDGNAMACSTAENAAITIAVGAGSAQTSAQENPAEETPAESTAEVQEPGSTDLTDLTITPGTLDFDMFTTEYTVTVENSVTAVAVQASLYDENSSYVVDGYSDLQVGSNTVTVVVTAADGSSKTYTVHVIRADEYGSTETSPETQETVQGFAYTTKGAEWYITTFPRGTVLPSAAYTYEKLNIDKYEVPAYRNSEDPEGLYLIYAAEGTSQAGLAWYRASDGMIYPYTTGTVTGGDGVNQAVSVPMYLIIVLGAICAILLITIIVLLVRRSSAEQKLINSHRGNGSERSGRKEKEEKKAAAEKKEEEKKETAPLPDEADDDDLDDNLNWSIKPDSSNAGKHLDFVSDQPLFADLEDDEDENREEEIFNEERTEENSSVHIDPVTPSWDSGEISDVDGSAEADRRDEELKDFLLDFDEDEDDDPFGDFAIDIDLIQKGIEQQAYIYNPNTAPASKPSRPTKPVVASNRISEPTTRFDAKQVKQNRDIRKDEDI